MNNDSNDSEEPSIDEDILDDQARIKETAQKLGKLIGQTDLGGKLKDAFEDFEDDEDAFEIFEEVQKLQKEVEKRQRSGQPIPDDMAEELNTKMRELEKEENFRKWMSVQEQFDRLMSDVQKVIQDGINEGQTSNIIEL